MNKILFIAITFLFFFISVSNAQWTQTNGPAGIDINVLFKSGNKLFAGTQAFGIYTSTDEGETWIKTNTGIETANIRAIIFYNNSLFAAAFGPGPKGIYRSTDEGQNWISVGGVMSFKPVRTLAVKDNYIFAGTPYPDGGLFRSGDAGVNWENLVPQSITSVDYIFVNGNSVLATEGNFIWYSGNNGNDWQLRYQFALGGANVMAATGNIILSARTSLKSTDNGITWNTSPSPGETYSLTVQNEIFYAGTTTGVYKSTDFGTTWIYSGAGISSGTVYSLLSDNTNIYAAVRNTSEAIYKSTDAGSSWQASSHGLEPASSIRSLAAKGNFIFAGMQADGIYRSSDNGASWKKNDTSNSSLFSAIVFTIKVKGNVIVAGTNHGMFRSVNDGLTWSRITEGLPTGGNFLSIYSLTVSRDNLVAAVYSDTPLKGIYYSSDEGLSWNQSNLSMGFMNSVSSNGDLTCLTVVSTLGTQNGLYRSTDGGITWVQNIFYFNNPDVQEIFGFGDKWLMSTLFTTYGSFNNGYDWFFSSMPCGSIFTFTKAGNQNLFGGNCEGMHRTTDWGITWQSVNEGFPQMIDVEASCCNSTYLFAGTSDHAVWRRPLSDFGITSLPNSNLAIPEDYFLSQNFPNPFNPETKITYSIPEKNFVSIKIYNSAGKELYELVNENKSSGNYTLTFNASDLSTGVYFYKLTAGNFSQTKKMILLK